MAEKFKSKEELHHYLQFYNLDGLDSEFSKTSMALVEAFSAKGMDINRWWIYTDVSWACPSCNRKKPEIVRLNQHGYLTGHLHEHHDHMENFVEQEFTRISENKKHVVADLLAKRFVVRTAFAFSAYDPTIICSDCNMADFKAKEIVNAPKEFSFSPAEIGGFVLTSPNKEHEIDPVKALETWKACREMFFVRKQLVLQVAGLAANNAHWYQPSLKTAKEVERAARHQMETYGLKAIEFFDTEKLLYSPNKFVGAADSWRKNTSRRSTFQKPNDGELQHLMKMSGDWRKVGDEWNCSVCGRQKVQCIRKSNSGKWAFVVSTAKVLYSEESIDYTTQRVVCNDCSDTATRIGKEVQYYTNIELPFASAVISPEELADVIRSNPHSKHQINHELLDKLLPFLVDRAQLKKAFFLKNNISELNIYPNEVNLI